MSGTIYSIKITHIKTAQRNQQRTVWKTSEFGYTCVCLNARSIVNKINQLNMMLDEPHIISITESWGDISDAELGMTGYVMFRKDRIGRRGGGLILFIKKIHPGL